MELKTKVHTIFMMVGATECGKSTFAREVMLPQLQFADETRNWRSNVQLLSSDSIRQELLGFPYDKYDAMMLEVSDQAFHLLFERLRAVTSFPVLAEFVIVDTTGLGEEFRQRVREIAKTNHYRIEVVLFDYRNRSDYYASERSKKLITTHLTRLRQDVLRLLKREGYDQVHRVRAKDFLDVETGRANPEYTVTVENLDAYVATMLPADQKYVVIGDVHECVEELQSLLGSFGFHVDADSGSISQTDRSTNTGIVLVGDWIDKGKRTVETIEFLYRNRHVLYLVLGNHESFIRKYLHGEIANVEPRLLRDYFDSHEVLVADAKLFAKFEALVAQSQPFFRCLTRDGASFFVTHSPCKKKYIGKLDSHSRSKQRAYRLDREKAIEPQLDFIKHEAVSNHPYHVFGHVAAQNQFRIKNKIHVDTGAVSGNQLTGVLMLQRPLIKHVKSKNQVLTESLPVLFQEDRHVSLDELGADELRRLRYCAAHRINYISGTMAPADKNESTGELESLAMGLEAFRERGIHEVVLQPKYMGSRCNLYLTEKLEDCYAVSRNGYKIQNLDLRPVFDALHNRLNRYMYEKGLKWLLIDGELMPWRALGDGLIERQFLPIETALEGELSFLREQGFEAAFAKLEQAYRESEFEHDQFRLSKQALLEKYGSNTYQNFKYMRGTLKSARPLSEHEQAFIVYRQQMERYAGDSEVHFKPFDVLKLVYTNGREELPDWPTSQRYALVTGDECLRLDLREEGALERALRFFETLTMEKGMEGVVIKPEHRTGRGVPYLKVRNPQYLSIIYGYDYRFPHKYESLLKQKNTQGKIRTSINEYRLGQKMLSVPLAEIAPGNHAFEQVAADLLFETVREKELDPRL